MLNFGKEGSMAIEPGFHKVEPSDIVIFLPTNSDHWVKDLIQPEGTKFLACKLDEAYTVTLAKEGLYVDSCPPHLMMSMVGVIQLGLRIWTKSVRNCPVIPAACSRTRVGWTRILGRLRNRMAKKRM
ncbi:plastocyanin/azurin family copper-binding protein [Paracoccus versutus]